MHIVLNPICIFAFTNPYTVQTNDGNNRVCISLSFYRCYSLSMVHVFIRISWCTSIQCRSLYFSYIHVHRTNLPNRQLPIAFDCDLSRRQQEDNSREEKNQIRKKNHTETCKFYVTCCLIRLMKPTCHNIWLFQFIEEMKKHAYILNVSIHSFLSPCFTRFLYYYYHRATGGWQPRLRPSFVQVSCCKIMDTFFSLRSKTPIFFSHKHTTHCNVTLQILM